MLTPSQVYVCGHCGRHVAPEKGYAWLDENTRRFRTIGICPSCEKPIFLEGTVQIPRPPCGNAVEGLPEPIAHAYDEARRCVQAGAPTAATLMMRKLLMNVAVERCAAPPGKSFAEYVSHLVNESKHLPTAMEPWLNHVRKKGNEATHEIAAVSEQDANDLLTFMEMVLKLVYEYPNRLKVAT